MSISIYLPMNISCICPLLPICFPDTVEVLEYLSPKYNLHIITNGFQEIQEKKLKGANIDQLF